MADLAWTLAASPGRQGAEARLAGTPRLTWLPQAADAAAEAVLHASLPVPPGSAGARLRLRCQRPWGGAALTLVVRADPGGVALWQGGWDAPGCEPPPLALPPGTTALRLDVSHRGAEALGLHPPEAEFAAAPAPPGRALPGTGWRLHGGRGAALEVAAGGLRLSAVPAGLRLAHPLPGGGQRLRWAMHGAPVLGVSVQAPGAPGQPWRTLLALPMAAGACRLDLPADLPAPLALLLEPPAGAPLALGPLTAEPCEAPPLPSRRSAAPALLRLAAGNDAFPALAAVAPVQAMRAQLLALRRLGLWDRMAALHRAILAEEPAPAWTAAERKALCQAWVALGDSAALRRALAEAPAQVTGDDELFAMAGRLALADGAAVSAYATLPSGRPNWALAARQPGLAALLLPQLVAAEAPPAGVDPAAALVLANHWCHRDEARWLAWLGAWAQAHGLGAPRLRPGPAPRALRLGFPAGRGQRRHPGISIVMAAHRAAGTVEAAIGSILGQSLAGVELLVCDDASDDETLAVLRRFVGHPQVRVFRSRGNQGPYNIRNALVPLARGRLVGFQDSDDLSHPRRLEWQLAALGQGVVASVAGHIRLRPAGEVAFFPNQQAERQAPVTCLAEREAVLASGLFRPVAVGADSEGLERLREQFGAAAVHDDPRPLLLALWSEGSLTRQAGLAQTEDGYLSPGRRALREAAALRRALGPAVMDTAAIDAIARRAGLWREPTGVEELTAP